jgi:hypothetical protein
MRDVHAKISHVLGWQKAGLLWEKSRAGSDGKMRSSGENVKNRVAGQIEAFGGRWLVVDRWLLIRRSMTAIGVPIQQQLWISLVADASNDLRLGRAS